jgi:cell division protein ZapB
MADDALKLLEQKIDQLIALCAQLNRENQSLKAENLNWRKERQALMERNGLARRRVEATLDRLRSMERGA